MACLICIDYFDYKNHIFFLVSMNWSILPPFLWRRRNIFFKISSENKAQGVVCFVSSKTTHRAVYLELTNRERVVNLGAGDWPCTALACWGAIIVTLGTWEREHAGENQGNCSRFIRGTLGRFFLSKVSLIDEPKLLHLLHGNGGSMFFIVSVLHCKG